MGKKKKWNTIPLFSYNIEAKAKSATLIKISNSDYKFWYPSKLIRPQGKKGIRFLLSYTNDFKFDIFKDGEKTGDHYTSKDQESLSAKEFLQRFYNISEEGI